MLVFFIVFIIIVVVYNYLNNEWKKQEKKEDEQRNLEYFTEHNRRINEIKSKYGNLTVEEIVLSDKIHDDEKRLSLKGIHGYSTEEAQGLISIAEKEAEKARLAGIKKKIAQKAQELYDCIPSDDNREPIADKVKRYVWQRDGGKCVKCGSQEKLEFDHIIPVSKGGSNTERNIQLLCEKCNRVKTNKI